MFCMIGPKARGKRHVLKSAPRYAERWNFGVAMTLLILDVRLPDNFHPRDGAELLQGLAGL
jgi:hypothetical protein